MNRVLKARLRRAVLVTLKNGASFRGVLMECDREALVLRNTEHVDGRGNPTPVDGELIVLLADVQFIQMV